MVVAERCEGGINESDGDEWNCEDGKEESLFARGRMGYLCRGEEADDAEEEPGHYVQNDCDFRACLWFVGAVGGDTAGASHDAKNEPNRDEELDETEMQSVEGEATGFADRVATGDLCQFLTVRRCETTYHRLTKPIVASSSGDTPTESKITTASKRSMDALE